MAVGGSKPLYRVFDPSGHPQISRIQKKNRVLNWPLSEVAKSRTCYPQKMAESRICHPQKIAESPTLVSLGVASSGLCHFLGVASPGLSYFRGWAVQDSVFS